MEHEHGKQSECSAGERAAPCALSIDGNEGPLGIRAQADSAASMPAAARRRQQQDPCKGEEAVQLEIGGQDSAGAGSQSGSQNMLVADGAVVNDSSFWQWAREDCGDTGSTADNSAASFLEWARSTEGP